MSKETLEALNKNTLIGFTEKRGNAWHYRADLQSDVPNHMEGPVPTERVVALLDTVTPVEAEITVTLPNGKVVTDPNRKAIVREETGRVYNYFSRGYQIHKPSERLVGFTQTLLDDPDAKVGTTGILDDGARAWVQFELPENRECHGLEYRPFLTAMTSLDGSLATTWKHGSTLVVCDNTLNVAARERVTQRKVKHTKNSFANVNLTEWRTALEILTGLGDGLWEEFDALMTAKVTERQFDTFVDIMAPLPEAGGSSRANTLAENKRDALHTLWASDERVTDWRGTKFGVLQTVNTYQQHIQTVRGAARWERNTSNFLTGKREEEDARTLRILDKVLA